MKTKNSPPALPERILTLLRQPNYHPLDKVELSQALGIDSSERRKVREALMALEQRGEVVRIRKDRYVLPREADLVVGVLQIHRNGNAHLLPETPGTPEAAIWAEDLGIGMDGDKVVARLKIGGRRGRGPDAPASAEVIRVLERRTNVVVGLLQQSARGLLFVAPDDPRFRHSVYARPGEVALPQAPRVGDKVVVRLGEWTDPRQSPEGEIIEVLGPAGAPGVDMLSVVRKYGLPTEFPPDVLREAESILETVEPAELARREDLRGKLVFTIDPDDARDFDDAIHLERTENGWRVGVHIADVSHYVRPGTALDREASKRGNSTYLADRVLPMLPERLSNGICSLKPHVERLAFSAFMEIDRQGEVSGARFSRTVIKSAARLSYRQALAILQGHDEVPPLPPSMEKETRGQATLSVGAPVKIDHSVCEAVRESWKLAAILRRRRFENGSLDLDFPEVKIWLDAEGKAVRLEKQENDISHQLIEEYMLAANEAVACELKSRSIPAVYRVHEDPAPERLQDFRDQVRVFGVKAGDLTQRREVQRVLAALRGLPEEYALKLQFLKSLKRAVYGTAPLGHYGLAKVNYTHFTSPIRRYADLLVHRALERARTTRRDTRDGQQGKNTRRFAEVAGPGELGAIAAHISATERVSADAEKESTLLKKLEYFQRQLYSKQPEQYRAVVVEARTFGLLVELPDVLMTGLIPVSALPEDFYQFDSVRSSFIGRRTQRTFKMGDELPVLVARVDYTKRQVDFTPVPEPGANPRSSREQPGTRQRVSPKAQERPRFEKKHGSRPPGASPRGGRSRRGRGGGKRSSSGS